MRIIAITAAFVLGTLATKAQTVATFDTLTLPGSDTCYINYAHPLADVGFNDGLAHFPCVYDTSYGGVWSSGFAYSNKRDTATSGYLNSYSAKIGSGYGGTGKYAVAYGELNMVKLTGAAIGKPVSGFYITNNTYAYNSMRDGDGFAKKFGDTTHTGLTTGPGTAPDWFKLTVKGYLSGTAKPDSVEFYLADFRPAGTANDSIIKGWHWVNLLPLGHVDSLTFLLSSSDTGMYGMNTPAHFCIDNFTTNETSLGLNAAIAPVFSVYPNPASDVLNISSDINGISSLTISDVLGNTVIALQAGTRSTAVDVSKLASGVYLVKLSGDGFTTTLRFVKQ